MDLETVRQTYAAWARHYDATHAWTLPYRRKARLVLGVHSGDRVLDLACGTGLNLRHLHDLVGEEGRVTGVDLSPEMLAIAEDRVLRHRWANVELHEADAARLPFENESFDRVICTFALNIVPDCRSAVAEVRRVMAASGRFVALEVGLETCLGAGLRPQLLKKWVDRVGGTCAVDLDRNTLSILQTAFGGLEVRRYFFGLFYLAVGRT